MIAVLVITGIVVLMIIGAILFFRKKQEKMMDDLAEMLETAMNGTFSEHSFDESKRSSLENRLAQYLAASELSVKSIALEREKIKELIADISHQTKTPLSNILLYTELLEEENLSDSAKMSLAMLRQQSEKLQFLIDALVKLSRLETGVFVLHPKVQPLYAMTEKCVEDFQKRAEEKGLELVLQVPDQKVLANFDEKWSGEALSNVLDNAIKYTKEGTITVTVHSYEMFACVEVSDTGIGIKEKEHAKVFQRFYRGEEVLDENGVGIGLYLARQIMQQQGGYIRLISRPSKGTSFGLYFSKTNVSEL